MQCFYCDKVFEARDVRPYGPKGEYICFDCATTPDHAAVSEMMFLKTLDACGPHVALTDTGPRPLTEEDINAH